MNKSKSYPLLNEKVITMRKSKSLDDLKEYDHFFEELFEGDGPLGIYFKEIGGKAIVDSIKKYTVAYETYGLDLNMELIEINNINIEKKDYREVMYIIKNSWTIESKVNLKFKKQIFTELFKILNENDLLKYYGGFIELGAKQKIDFDYVEYDDLTLMNMNAEDIEKFKKLNDKL